MDEGILTMMVKERERLRVVQALVGRRLRQREAAAELGLTVRQVKRLRARYRQDGDAGIVSRRRAVPSNRRLPASLRASVLAQVRRHYADFGPTLAGEMLRERYQLVLSVESLLQLMIQTGLWVPRRERAQALQIGHIAAHSPQAKGRVERANKTLQDRLVKALRLAGSRDIETANAFLPGLLARHNARCAVAPAHPRDAHRPLVHSPQELAVLLCRQYPRQVDRALCIQFENSLYRIDRPRHRRRMAHQTVTVLKDDHDALRIHCRGQDLPFRLLRERPEPPPTASRKSLDQALQALSIPHQPAPDHPWRKPAVTAHA